MVLREMLFYSIKIAIICCDDDKDKDKFKQTAKDGEETMDRICEKFMYAFLLCCAFISFFKWVYDRISGRSPNSNRGSKSNV